MEISDTRKEQVTENFTRMSYSNF